MDFITVEKRLSAEEYEGLLFCSTAVFEGRRLIYDFCGKMTFITELLQAAGLEESPCYRLPADAGAFYYVPEEHSDDLYERLEGQVVHYGRGPFNERMVFVQLLRTGRIFVRHDAASELANDTLPVPEPGEEASDILVTFDELETVREEACYRVRFTIGRGRIFWPDAIRAVCNAKIYYIYRRNYPFRNEAFVYRSRIIEVLDEKGAPADKGVAEEIMNKYRFSELI